MYSLTLAAKSHQGVNVGIQGCHQQILANPMGQYFLHLLHEDLVADFCKSPALLVPLAGLFDKVMEEGH